ncbi:MAG: 50S ribosomal protein L10 [Bacteroidetes bacterium]|nr:50S ribosomal protein L10 [Bacteroidota bacterium]MBV6460430.1 50S ribosomal protein L10 [Flavobacteriales bacterium]WKZ74177.1 MAG: 50S ribosomal protein L10 [Vicingaceae bacterium]MCL4817336.1 50S ribosomal protein L10 [Flavobacteriales bacterium]NOG95910.1 50S ribosomal protein L10 [Bacteroidota bacterium]
MNREQKNAAITLLTEKLNSNNVLYIADISALDAEKTNSLRRMCNSKNVKLHMVKNTLLKKAMEQANGNYEGLYDVLKGNSSILFAEVGNAPGKIIKEFRKKNDKPVLKGAYIDEAVFIGDNQLETLANLKSREELIGDIIMLLQSPAKNVISGLLSGKNKIAGLVKTLQDRAN